MSPQKITSYALRGCKDRDVFVWPSSFYASRVRLLSHRAEPPLLGAAVQLTDVPSFPGKRKPRMHMMSEEMRSALSEIESGAITASKVTHARIVCYGALRTVLTTVEQYRL